MSRREAKDHVIRAFEIAIKVLGFAIMLWPLVSKRKPKKRTQPK